MLKSGKELNADIIVTAAGFNLSVFGDIEFSIDGAELNYQDRWTWRGIMATDLPNLAAYFGYLRTSWTMRVDLVSDLACRLLNHMDEKQVKICIPKLRADDTSMTARPFIDPQEFNPGYLTRAIHLFPKQGDYAPWLLNQDYYSEKDELPVVDFEDGTLEFT